MPSLPCSIFLMERCAGGGAGGSSDLPAEVAPTKIYYHIMGAGGQLGEGEELGVDRC